MMPDNSLSTTPMLGEFLLPDKQPSLLVTKEYGGIALNDPSAGLQYQVWTCYLDGVNVMIEAPNHPASVLFSRIGVSELSLAFDQNMRPFVAFVSGGQAEFWWYDTAIPGETFTLLEVGASSPRATLDDHREIQTTIGTTDIILAYVFNNALCMRMERDRYTVLYTLLPNLNTILINPSLYTIGMNDVNRLQFFLRGNFISG